MEKLSQPTLNATQPVEDPRRQGTNLSNVSDGDATDVICLLHPNSPAAFDAVKANLILAPQHLLQNDDLEGIDEEDLAFNPIYHQPRDIALRMSSEVRNPKDGYRFGRWGSACDILLTPNADEALVSKVHFKIFVNSQGSLMLQDLSTNGTLVDDIHLTTRDRRGGKVTKTATTVLKNGSIISVVAGRSRDEIKFMVRIPNRGDKEDQYEENLRKYLAARGNVAQFASMRESLYGNHWNGGSLYNFTGLLGKGAFATVYRVQTKKEGDVYAAKELDKRRFIKNGVLDMKFDSELKIMKNLSHPNIVNYVDCQNYQHWIYILMEYVPHGELAEELRRKGRIPEDEVQQITRQILHALDYLHKQNITHRDIKPDNILIASRSPLVVKLSDFGLSKCVNDQETFLKTFCGTLLYCAPEVYPDYGNYASATTKRRRLGEPASKALPSPYDQSVDMWSFGAVIFHMLCGKPPILGRGDDRGAQMLNNIMTKDVDFLPLKQAGVSSDAIDFIARLLQRTPHLRPKEGECLQHPWLRQVEDNVVYDNVASNFEETLNGAGVVDVVDDDLIDVDFVANLQQLTSQPTSSQTPDRPSKKPRREFTMETVAREVGYPALPSLGQGSGLEPSQGIRFQPDERLFGEVTPSLLRSSGIFGQNMQPVGAADVPEISHGIEQVSVNDFVAHGDIESPPQNAFDSGRALQRTLAVAAAHPQDQTASAASLFGQLNMASPEAEASDAATPDTANPVTPLTRELTPSNLVSQTEAGNAANTNDISEPLFTRRIDLGLVTDPENFAAEVRARDASRAEKMRTSTQTFHGKAGDRIYTPPAELAVTIDARTGHEVGLVDTTSGFGGKLCKLPVQEELREDAGQFLKPPKRLGKLVSVPGSFANITINLETRLTSWGRGFDCTVPYADRKDTRIPKYAMKVTFWAPGMEKHLEGGGKWVELSGIRTLLSTSASKNILVNGVELRKESADGQAALFGQLFTGDIITVFDDGNGQFLKFKVEVTFGDSARQRPIGEDPFRIQEERQHHQRVMKERESMQMSRIMAGDEG